MMCLHVGNLWWEYNPGAYFTMLAQCASGKPCEQSEKSCFRQCPWGSCITWQCERSKETSMIREREKKKQVSVSVADSYQRCWACQFCIFGCRDTEIVHWWKRWKCAWWKCLPPARKNKNKNLPLPLCPPPPSNLSSMRYVQRSSFQNSAGLKLLFSSLVSREPLPELCLFARHAIPQQEGIVRLDWVRGCCCLWLSVYKTRVSARTLMKDTLWPCVSRAAEIQRDRHVQLVRRLKKRGKGRLCVQMKMESNRMRQNKDEDREAKV